MAVTIVIPTPLRGYAGGLGRVEVEANTAGEALSVLVATHSGLKNHLYSPEGKLRSYVNVYLGTEDIRYLQKDATPLKAGDTLSIVPAIAGGVEL